MSLVSTQALFRAIASAVRANREVAVYDMQAKQAHGYVQALDDLAQGLVDIGHSADAHFDAKAFLRACGVTQHEARAA